MIKIKHIIKYRVLYPKYIIWGDIMTKKINRVGEINYNKYGTQMKIIEYNNNKKIKVEFQDKYKAIVSTSYSHFLDGTVKNPYDKSVLNVGYLGEGKYNSIKDLKVYLCWKNMLKRCYDPYYLNKYPTYIDCYVCKEWHCFQYFAEWFYNNYYEIEGEVMHLDKDILIKGNKIYSPKTCVFVPNNINQLFVKTDSKRGKLPIGVTEDKRRGTYSTFISHINYGYFKDIRSAWLMYKFNKELIIQSVADEYKDLIPTKLYDAMYKYEVEMND